jgi:hypothetical protein
MRGVVGWICPENQEPGTSREEEERDEGKRKKKKEIILKNRNIVLQ